MKFFTTFKQLFLTFASFPTFFCTFWGLSSDPTGKLFTRFVCVGGIKDIFYVIMGGFRELWVVLETFLFIFVGNISFKI